MAAGDGDALAGTISSAVISLGVQSAENATEVAEAMSDLNKTILTDGAITRLNLANAERDLQNRIHETRIEALKTAQTIEHRITGFERNVDSNFKDVVVSIEKNTQVILAKMAEDKAAALKDELDETRLELMCGKNANILALQNLEIASVKQMINSVEQNQRFSSKTVQFGAGNVAIPTQTANQG